MAVAAGSAADKAANDKAVKKLARQAFGPNAKARSAQVNATIDIDVKGVKRWKDPIEITLDGGYELAKGAEVPDFKLEAGLLLRDQAYGGAILLNKGKAYLEVGTTGYQQSDEIARHIAAPAPKYDNGMTKTAGMFYINPNSWRKNTKIVGDADVAGEPTTHVTADIRTDRFFSDMAKLIDLLTDLRVTEISGLPTNISKAQQAALVRSVKTAKGDVYFGKDRPRAAQGASRGLDRRRAEGPQAPRRDEEREGGRGLQPLGDRPVADEGDRGPVGHRIRSRPAAHARRASGVHPEGARHEVTPAGSVAQDAPSLIVEGVTKRFGERVAVHDVSFEVARGELLAIIGPNGAGKTTLLSMLGGIRSPDAGTVRQQGPNADKRIGWVPQQTAIYAKLTVAQNLRLFARLEKVADPDAVVQRMLEQTALEERADDELVEPARAATASA